MKTRILAIILLGAVLISVLSSCGRIPYPRYADTTPNNNIPDAIGRGAFPEELTEEHRAFCEGTAKELAKEVDLSALTGFSNVQTDLSVYYAQRRMNMGNLYEGVRDDLDPVITASADFDVVFPVYETIQGEKHVIAHIVVSKTEDGYSSDLQTEDYFAAAHGFGSILNEMPSFSFFEEFCQEKELGTLQAVSLLYVEPLERLYEGKPINDFCHVILLETDRGAYIQDPTCVRIQHYLDHLGESRYDNDKSIVFENKEFGEAIVYRVKEERKEFANSIKEFFLEAVISVIKGIPSLIADLFKSAFDLVGKLFS
ncbi:MAG: hypothetical protein IJY89_04470 [Clostridia bacterium]|nr:hypothetical protein [Clostridia bacterium]